MDFPFDVTHLFPQPIICVKPHQLRPKDPGCRLSQILNKMGVYSALAQDLNHAVTIADKLHGDQVVYLIADKDSGRVAVTGLLKVGTKNLFLYDKAGHVQRCDNTPAILDFYVHESRQRRGQGKRLFEHMLAEQGWRAVKCSIDRPSHKLIGFLQKHYGLTRTIPQLNNFVTFDGFFDEKGQSSFSGLLASVSRSRNNMDQGWEQPQQGHGRQQSDITARTSSTEVSSVADVMGAGERISNRPPPVNSA